MNQLGRWASIAATIVGACGAGMASAQTSVSFGRITAVTMVTQDNQNARVGGAIVGGAIGAAPPPTPAQPTATDRSQAESCIRAKEQLLEADTDDAFDRAERRVRLLCGE